MKQFSSKGVVSIDFNYIGKPIQSTLLEVVVHLLYVNKTLSWANSNSFEVV